MVHDVIVAGGGLAGSLTAAMLGKAGHRVALVDPFAVYPPDFRCEKLDGSQLELLRRTGLAREILCAGTKLTDLAIAMRGRHLCTVPLTQYGMDYDHMVNTVRGLIGESVTRLTAKVTGITQGRDVQTVATTQGELRGRLVVIATGLGHALRQSLGISRQEISPQHSVSIGFDVEPQGPARFPWQGLTYYPENAAQRMAYISLFSIGGRLRANLFIYCDPRDPRIVQFRRNPDEALHHFLPGLARLIGPYRALSPASARPVDLYRAQDVARDGIVLVGDAFSTSCPAAGTGVTKVLTDVTVLCRHVPGWLATPGMTAEKIAQFYVDPEKSTCEDIMLGRALRLKKFSTGKSLFWRARRGLAVAHHAWLGARYGTARTACRHSWMTPASHAGLAE